MDLPIHEKSVLFYLERVDPTGIIVFNSSANSGTEKNRSAGQNLGALVLRVRPDSFTSHYCFTICMTSAGIKGFEFQRDLFSHNLQYLKKAHNPQWAVSFHLAADA